MAIHYHDPDAPWYASLWVLLVVFVVAALLIVWYAFSRQEALVTQAQQPDQTLVVPVPGPQGPAGPAGPQGPAGQSNAGAGQAGTEKQNSKAEESQQSPPASESPPA